MSSKTSGAFPQSRTKELISVKNSAFPNRGLFNRHYYVVEVSLAAADLEKRSSHDLHEYSGRGEVHHTKKLLFQPTDIPRGKLTHLLRISTSTA